MHGCGSGVGAGCTCVGGCAVGSMRVADVRKPCAQQAGLNCTRQQPARCSVSLVQRHVAAAAARAGGGSGGAAVDVDLLSDEEWEDPDELLEMEEGYQGGLLISLKLSNKASTRPALFSPSSADLPCLRTSRPATHAVMLTCRAVPEGGEMSQQLVRMRGWLLRIVQAMEL